MHGYSAHGGSLETLPEVGLPGKRHWCVYRVPQILYVTLPPGGETENSVFGIAVRVLLRATPLSHGMVSYRRWVEDGPFSALRGCSSAHLAFLF